MKNWYKTKHTFLHPYLVQPTGFQQSWIYLHFPPDKQACLSPSGVCEPDSAQSAERVHLQVGSTNAKKTGSLPFGQYFSLAAGKQVSRRFTLKCEPDSAQSAKQVRLPSQFLPMQKRREVCPLGNIFRLPLGNKLPDGLRSNVNPIRHKVPSEFN